MADGTVTITIGIEEARYMAALADAANGLARVEGGAAGVASATRKAAREQAELGRQAQQVLRDIQTPQEHYNQQLEKLNRLLSAGKLSQEQFGTAAKKAGDELEDAGSKGHKAFGHEAVAMAKEFAGALGLGFGIAEGVKLIKEEWESVIKVQERALEATLPVANAQRKFRGAAGFESPEEAEAFDKRIEEASAATGVTSKDLYVDAAAAMKDRHGLSKDQAMEAVIAAAERSPEDGGTRQEDAQKAMGVMHTLGMNARQAIGWTSVAEARSGLPAGDMTKLLNSLPGEDPKQIMAVAQAMHGAGGKEANAVIGIFKALATGVNGHSSEEAAAEKRKLTEDRQAAEQDIRHAAASDPEYLKKMRGFEESRAQLQRHKTHDPAKIAERNLEERKLGDEEKQAMEAAQRRAEASPEHVAKLAGFDARARAIKKKEEIGENFVEQLTYVQAHPELADEMAKGVAKGKGAQSFAKQILTGTGPRGAVYKKALTDDISAEESELQFNKDVKAEASGGMQNTGKLSRGQDVGSENLATANESGTNIEAVRKNFVKNLVQSGEGAFSAGMTEQLFNRITPRQQLDFARHTYRQREELLRGNDTAHGTHWTPSAEDTKKADALEMLAKGIDHEIKRSAEKLSNAADKLTAAASSLERSRQNRPALGTAHGDPGDRR